MTVSLAGALAACRAAVDTARAAIAARDDRLIEDAVIDFKNRLADVTDRVLALQEKQAAQAEREHQLESKIRELEDRSADFSSYELYRTARGGITYRSKAPVAEGQEPVHLCANCIAQGIKTFLQPVGINLRCNVHGVIPSDTQPRKLESRPAGDTPWSARNW